MNKYGRLRKRKTANKKNNETSDVENEAGSKLEASDAKTRTRSTCIAMEVYEDTSDSTSISDFDESSLYPPSHRGAYHASDCDNMSLDTTSISSFDERDLRSALHEGARLSSPSSLTSDLGSDGSATRVFQSRSSASRRVQEPAPSKRGRRTRASD